MNKILTYGWEFGKWGVVGYLLWPLTGAFNGPVDFARVVIGEAIMIILIGKLFYDTVIWKFMRQRQKASKELIGMLGIVAAVGFILVMFFLLSGVTLLMYLRGQANSLVPVQQ